jgi:hypothetical protein
MAPSKAGAAVAPFEKEERVLCFHHDMLYEAKILDSRPTENSQSFQYRIHYKGWKNTVSLFYIACRVYSRFFTVNPVILQSWA